MASSAGGQHSTLTRCSARNRCSRGPRRSGGPATSRRARRPGQPHRLDAEPGGEPVALVDAVAGADVVDLDGQPDRLVERGVVDRDTPGPVGGVEQARDVACRALPPGGQQPRRAQLPDQPGGVVDDERARGGRARARRSGWPERVGARGSGRASRPRRRRCRPPARSKRRRPADRNAAPAFSTATMPTWAATGWSNSSAIRSPGPAPRSRR